MPSSNLNEIVDERIIDLLGIGQLFDIDSEEYYTLLSERIQRSAFGADKLSPEDLALLSNEKKRIRGTKENLKIVRKKITAESFKRKSSVENVDNISVNLGNQKSLVGDKTSNIGESLEILSKNLLGGPLESSIVSIATAVNSILDTLTQQKKLSDAEAANERKTKERERRASSEAKLEKRFDGLKKSIEKVLSPVKSILDKIIDFFLTMVVGRVIFKLLDWLGDPNNRDKVRSIIRFFKDHWSKLLSLYIIFGTSFGKFARGLVSLIVKGSVRLAAATAGLLAKKGVKKAGKVASFLGGNKGKMLAAGLETVAVIGGTMALTKGLENFDGIGGEQKVSGTTSSPSSDNESPPRPEKPESSDVQRIQAPASTQKYSGGGQVKSIPVPAFSGGGLNIVNTIGDISKNIIPGLGVLRLILEHINKSKTKSPKKNLRSDDKKVRKVPAMLSDGEFVLSPGAVAKYGVRTLESMNAAGGGTNKPKVVNQKTYAAGGGFIGKVAEHLKKDEALSSLSRGKNDFIKPGGRSVSTGKSWNTLTPKTPIHSYIDSVGQPTIGWGSTYYDSILNGRKPVKSGDTITKEKADSILNTNIFNLSSTYSRKIPTWNKMSDDQKAGVLLVGYNAPYGPIGSYPNLTNSLKIGDMVSAASNVQRGGPSASRIAAERKLLLSGPKDLAKSTTTKPTANQSNQQKNTKPQPNIIQRISTGVRNIFSSPFSRQSEPKEKVQKFSNGGLVIPTFKGGGLNIGSLSSQNEKMISMEPHKGMVTGKSGITIKGSEPDTQLIAARRGEQLIVPEAVSKYGPEHFEEYNRSVGASNKPGYVKGSDVEIKSFNTGGLVNDKSGPTNIKISSQQDFNNFKKMAESEKFQERLTRIEKQIQVQTALSSGKGLNVRGATFGTDIGKGFKTTFRGREAIKVRLSPGGSYENEIILGGKRYFAVKQGDNIIYVSNFDEGLKGQTDKYGAVNKSYTGQGGKIVGGYGLKGGDTKNLPKTRIMTDDKGKPFVGYLTFVNGVPFYDRPKKREKGILENITNFFDPKGAKVREENLNARTLRLTAISDLESYRKNGMKEENIKKMLNQRLGPNGYSRAVNDLKAKQTRVKKESDVKDQYLRIQEKNYYQQRGVGGMGGLGSDYKKQEQKLAAAAKISPSKPKPKVIKPPAKPAVKVIKTKQTNRRGAAPSSRSTPQNTVPAFKPTSRGAAVKSQLMGVHR